MSAIVRVIVEFECPLCGSDGYEHEFDPDDLANTTVTIPCDDCGVTIDVDADARVTAKAVTP